MLVFLHPGKMIECGARVQVADGDGQSVRGIGWLRDFFEPKQPRDHELHLLFFGFAISDDGGLDGERRVFSDFDLVRRSRQHGHAANVSELERGLHIHCVEDIFDGNAVRMKFENHPAEFVENRGKPRREWSLARDMDRAEIYALQFVARVEFDQTVSRALATAIDSKHAHLSKVYKKNGSGPAVRCLLTECCGAREP